MSRFTRHSLLIATTLAGALFVSGRAAHAETIDTLDLVGGLGFSTNANTSGNGNTSGFGRLSAYGNHNWTTERSSTSVHGFVENTFYFQHYGSQRIFDVGADTNFTVSPTLSLYGNLVFLGDFNGQLSNRLFGVPSGPPPVNDPNNPLPPPTVGPSVFAFNGHSYRVNGQVGASIRSGELSTISLGAGAQHGWYTGNSAADYTTYFGHIGYSRQLSERTSLGPALYFTHQDYTFGRSANVINPTLTAHTQLSESVSADGSIGVLVLEDHRLGHTDTTVSPSFSLGICSQGQVSSLCAHVARDAQSAFNNPTAVGSRGSVTTTGDLSYFRRVSERGTVQASFYATHYSTGTTGPSGQDFSQTYLSAVAGYDHKIGQRLFTGVTVGSRKVFQTGPDPKVDFNGNIYLRYRIGDVQ